MQFKKEDGWYTWIDYPTFHELVSISFPYSALESSTDRAQNCWSVDEVMHSHRENESFLAVSSFRVVCFSVYYKMKLGFFSLIFYKRPKVALSLHIVIFFAFL